MVGGGVGVGGGGEDAGGWGGEENEQTGTVSSSPTAAVVGLIAKHFRCC